MCSRFECPNVKICKNHIGCCSDGQGQIDGVMHCLYCLLNYARIEDEKEYYELQDDLFDVFAQIFTHTHDKDERTPEAIYEYIKSFNLQYIRERIMRRLND